LSDNRRRHHGNDARFKPRPMVSPYRARITIRSDQDGGGVHHRGHADRCSGRSRPVRRRAASSSSRVKAPFSASHSATATRPSRSLRARRAASVIQAETLTPSACAAATIRAWTSGATVIASLGEGLPRGIAKLYYHGRRMPAPTHLADWSSLTTSTAPTVLFPRRRIRKRPCRRSAGVTEASASVTFWLFTYAPP
jgi:hypothetical protein